MREKTPFPTEYKMTDHEKILYDAHFNLIEGMRNFHKDYIPEYGSKWWLPIDEVIKKIASRDRRPKLRPETEKSRYASLIWRIFGPYDLARSHIEMAFLGVASLTRKHREREIEEAKRFLDNCGELRDALAEFTRIEIDQFPYIEAIMRDFSKEERSFKIEFT